MSAVAGDQTLTKRQERLFGIIEKVSQILEGSPSNAGTHTEIQASREQLPATTDGRNVEPYTPMRRWKEETFADQSFHGLRN
ncbi:hypothetical protein AJ80_06123 [Polytolypa hystricis UAMH7299]|uniref:Uncharacterized protein n=1 Tax=Polytolypa hystricis (strain UAMH7299) TaxID=1447883 RepID=A0A2B7XYY0_POLH7|nr:hypothetical protein AJ80_06123 [Polytolypa hystricis UAMH7299]